MPCNVIWKFIVSTEIEKLGQLSTVWETISTVSTHIVRTLYIAYKSVLIIMEALCFRSFPFHCHVLSSLELYQKKTKVN